LDYYPISFGVRGKGSFEGIPHKFSTVLSADEGRAYFFKDGAEYGADEGEFRGIPASPDVAFTTCGSRVGACAF
jgi:hypothetical protein